MEDKTNIIESEILPHILEIKKVCLLNKIPCFISVAAGDFPEVKTIRERVNKDGKKEIEEVVSENAEEDGKWKTRQVQTGNLFTKYISEIISPAVAGVHVEEDKITEMLKVMNGYETVDPKIRLEVDF